MKSGGPLHRNNSRSGLPTWPGPCNLRETACARLNLNLPAARTRQIRPSMIGLHRRILASGDAARRSLAPDHRNRLTATPTDQFDTTRRPAGATSLPSPALRRSSVPHSALRHSTEVNSLSGISYIHLSEIISHPYKLSKNILAIYRRINHPAPRDGLESKAFVASGHS